MGGINSGRRRTVHRGSVEQFPCIDLRILKRAGLLNPGECMYDTLCWRNQGLEALEVRIFVDLSNDHDAALRIVINDGGRNAKQRVAIECVACRYGGARYYFFCPLLGMRCEQLFLVDGILASRRAHRLTYASQCEDELTRARRKVRRLMQKLEGNCRYAKPRGSNRGRSLHALHCAENEARKIYRERLSAMLDME